MKYILTLLAVIAGCIIMLLIIIPLENQLSDCQFECNHLQAKLWRLEELNDYIPAMEQALPPLILAQLKVVTLMIKNEKYKEFEKSEQPLIEKK